VEKFGSVINTSFFETANLLGTMKIKGYLNIEPSVGGLSRITITEAGKGVLLIAEKKAAEPIEPLDNALLHALAGGATTLEAVHATLNVRSADLAYHINKLVAQGFADYTARSSKVFFTLTEQGFNSTGGVKVGASAPAQPAQQISAASQHQAQKDDKKTEHHHKHVAEKEDVKHLLNDEHHEAHRHETAEEDDGRPLTPEEQKRRRMASKIRYYAAEYGPWIVLMIVVGLVFLGAVYLMISKGTP
jgi:hypothetical protein